VKTAMTEETLKPSKTSTIRVQPTRNYLEWVHSVKFTLDEKENKSIQPKTLYNKEKMILQCKNGNIKIPLLCALQCNGTINWEALLTANDVRGTI
jgi:hypothetical protein